MENPTIGRYFTFHFENCILFLMVVLLLQACYAWNKKAQSAEMIIDPILQETIFKNLINLAENKIEGNTLSDSLAFLILPVQASCPACRRKTIDSIVKHQTLLARHRYIIISANGGRKTIGAYFIEQDKKLPSIENRLFLDSTNWAFKHQLYYDKPTIYYAYNRKVYKKVSAIPTTVKEDLREFFSGK
jgi:hypothetical protein